METDLPKPMLAYNGAGKEDKLIFPLFAQVKYDGVRVRTWRGRAWSRSGKLIPNLAIQYLAGYLPDGLDAEIVVSGQIDWSEPQSIAMSRDAKIDRVDIRVFDSFRPPNCHESFHTRWHKLSRDPRFDDIPNIAFAWTEYIMEAGGLQRFVNTLPGTAEGYVTRSPRALYKFGRATLRKQELIKFKTTEDLDARIVGWDPLERIDGTIDSTMAGRLHCVTYDGVHFAVGSGLDNYSRRLVATNPEDFMGKLAKIKYINLTPALKPRSPVFMGLRHPDDIS